MIDNEIKLIFDINLVLILVIVLLKSGLRC